MRNVLFRLLVVATYCLIASAPMAHGQSLAAGMSHACSVSHDAKVHCWGVVDGIVPNPGAVPTPVSGIPLAKAVFAGGSQTCAVAATGALWCWGDDANGSVSGIAPTTYGIRKISPPVAVAGLPDPAVDPVVSVAIGQGFACALLGTSKTVYCWGRNQYGYLGDGTQTDRGAPQAVSGLSNVDVIASGGEYTCAILSGAVKCWGRAYSSASLNTAVNIPTPITGLPVDATSIAVGSFYLCAHLADGTVWCSGSNFSGQLGSATPSGSDVRQVTGLTGVARRVYAAYGGDRTCVIFDGGSVECFGGNRTGELGINSNASTGRGIVAGLFARSVAMGPAFSCAETVGGSVRCWGDGRAGRLGNGQVLGEEHSPVLASALATDFNLVELGDYSANGCGARSSGALACWGSNSYGRGVVSVAPGQSNPAALPPLDVTNAPPNTVQIALGSIHGCARYANGSVWCWGNNANGPLGVGDNSQLNGARQALLPAAASVVAASWQSTCAVVTGGSVYCWGLNNNGQIGLGAIGSPVLTPTLVPSLSGVVDLKGVGGSGFCALLDSGNVKCWGGGFSGASVAPPADLRSGYFSAGVTFYNRIFRSGTGVACAELNSGQLWCSPVGSPPSGANLSDVFAGRPFSSVAFGRSSACAVFAGTVECVGTNDRGQLGRGSFTTAPQSLAPLGAPGISEATQIVSDNYASYCARRASGEYLCWGVNDGGQLANGATTFTTAPTSFASTPNLGAPLRVNDAPQASAAVDAMILVRALSGMTNSALIEGLAMSSGARQAEPDVTDYVARLRQQSPQILDVDGDGQTLAATDGLLLTRYLLGQRGDALITGALGPDPKTRSTAADIEQYLAVATGVQR